MRLHQTPIKRCPACVGYGQYTDGRGYSQKCEMCDGAGEIEKRREELKSHISADTPVSQPGEGSENLSGNESGIAATDC